MKETFNVPHSRVEVGIKNGNDKEITEESDVGNWEDWNNINGNEINKAENQVEEVADESNVSNTEESGADEKVENLPEQLEQEEVSIDEGVSEQPKQAYEGSSRTEAVEAGSLESIEDIEAEFENRFQVFEEISSSVENGNDEEVKKIIDNGKKVKGKFDSILHDDENYEKTIKQKYLNVINSTINLLELKKSNNEQVNEVSSPEATEAENLESVEDIEAEFENRYSVFEDLSNSLKHDVVFKHEESVNDEEVKELVKDGKKISRKFHLVAGDSSSIEGREKAKYLRILNEIIRQLESIKATENPDDDSEKVDEEVSPEAEKENQLDEEIEGKEDLVSRKVEFLDNEKGLAYKKARRELIGVRKGGDKFEGFEGGARNEYKAVKAEYDKAVDDYYNQGGFKGNVNKVKRFFGIGLKAEIPEDLKTRYHESKSKYINGLNNALKARSGLSYEVTEGGVTEVDVNEKYNQDDPKTKMSFLNKFVVRSNKEMLEKQEVHLLSEEQRKTRDRILGTIVGGNFSKTKQIAVMTGMTALGGLPVLAAIVTGMVARKITQKYSVDKAQSNIDKIKSGFSIDEGLADFEESLLQAEINKKNKIRNQKAVTIGAAMAAGLGTHFATDVATSSMAEGVDLSSVRESGQSISEDFSEKMGETIDRMTEKSKGILDELSKFAGDGNQGEAVNSDVNFKGNNPYYDSPENNPFDIKSEQLLNDYKNPDLGINEAEDFGVNEAVVPNEEVANLGFAEEGGVESSLEVSHEYKVTKGDNLWKIIRSEYSEVLSDLSPPEQNVALNKLFNVVRDSPELIESLNLNSGNNIDLIYPNETIDVGQLGEELKRIVGYEDSISESSTYTKSSNLDIQSDSGEGDVKIKFKAENPFENNLNENLNGVQTEELLKKYEPANMGFSAQENLPTDQVKSIEVPVELEPKPDVVSPDVFDNVAKVESAEGVHHAVYRESVPSYEFVSQGTPEFNEMIENIYGNKEKFYLEVIKEAKMIESESYDFLDKLLKKDSPYETFLQDMTIGEISEFDNQARDVIDQELGSNVKYETYRKWVEFTEHLKEVDPNISSDTKLKEVFSEFVMNNKLAEIIPEVSSNKTINV